MTSFSPISTVVSRVG